MLSNRRTKIHPLRILFWVIASMLAMVLFLDRYPIVLKADETIGEGAPVYVEGQGEVVVVVSASAIAAAAEDGERDRSYAWADMIRQEVGPVTIVDVAGLTPEVLQGHRVVILTRSASSHPQIVGRVDEFDAFVRNGGRLALELPTGGLRERFGADGEGGWRTPGAITATFGVADPVASLLRETPLITQFLGSTRRPDNTTTLMAMDGSPVVYGRNFGRGAAIVFDFDVGGQISALQQGLPNNGDEVQPRRSGNPIRTSDMVPSTSMIGADAPYADMLERFVVRNCLGFGHPMFVLWPYPDGGHGALVSSHDSRSLQGRPLWMSIHEQAADANTVTFISPPTSGLGADFRFDDIDYVDLSALMWVIEPSGDGLQRRIGAFGVHPIRQSWTLPLQYATLDDALGDPRIYGVRIWDSRWTRDVTRPFRIMQATGGSDATDIRYSVSYGPAPDMPPGFLFGTCQPYTPIDVNGLPFSISEVPVCFANPDTPDARDSLMEALAASAEHGWAVHLLTSADRFRERPNMIGFDAWRDALRFAERNSMWVGGAGELVAFSNRRAEAELRVIASEIRQRDNDGTPRIVEYTIEVEVSGGDHSLTLPEMSGGLSLTEIETGTQHIDVGPMTDRVESDQAMMLGHPVRIVPIAAGFSTYTLRYSR